jgi:hypothetical protein
MFRKWDWGVDWVVLAHDRDRWRAVVTAVMIFGFLNCRDIFE